MNQFKVYLLLIFVPLITSCNGEKNNQDLNSVFESTRIVDVNLDSADYSFSDVLVPIYSRNYYAFFDPSSYKFLLFENNGSYITSFGNKGRGPLEFTSFTSSYLTDNGDLYIYDQGSGKLILYSVNEESKEIYLNRQVIDFAVSNNGNILVYALASGRDNVLTLFNKDGNVIKEFFVPSDQNYKKFLFRFKDGGIEYHSIKEKYYFLYPDSYKIYAINENGQFVDTLNFINDKYLNEEIKEFPESLNPFQISPQHWEYWSSFTHPSDIKILEEDQLLLKSYKMMDASTWDVFYSIYSFNGDKSIEGFIIPDSIKVAGGSNNFLHTYINGKLNMHILNEY